MEALGGLLEPLAILLERLRAFLEPAWSPLGGFLEPLEALFNAIWPETEHVQKQMVFLVLGSLSRSWRRRGSVSERLGGVLEASWSVLKPSGAVS